MTHALTLTRDFDAPPEAIWRCLTEPDLVAQWFAPAPVTVTRADVDARPGGTIHIVMQVPEMSEMDGGAGCILEAVPCQRLSWTTALAPGFAPKPAPEDGEMRFTAIFALEASATGTRYTVTALHPDDATRATHEAMGFHEGWGTCADQLGKLAATL